MFAGDLWFVVAVRDNNDCDDCGNRFFCSQMEKTKITLVDAYVRRGCALVDMIRNAQTEHNEEANATVMREIDELFIELLKWTEITDSKVSYICILIVCISQEQINSDNSWT